MDKSKWEYKKLGEVCLDFVVPQRDKPTAFDGDIPWCRIEDIEGRYLNGSKSGQNVTKELADRMNMHICPKGTVISACSASIGNQAITTIDCYTNQTFIGLVVNPVLLYNEYLYYFLESKTSDLQKMGQGATIKYISKDKYKKMLIPLPSIADQQRIVAELDCLNEMIAVKQEQLKEFDKLAQSIFYDMFLNEDNASFERMGLKECVKEMHLGPFGSALKNEFFVPQEQGYCMVYEQQHAIKKTMDLPTRYVDEDKYRELERFEVGPGDILMSCRGTIGEVYIIPDNAPKGIIHPSLMKIRLNPTYIEKTYFLFLLSYVIKDKDSNGATIKMAITAKELGKEKIPLPPLELQQQFADKISAIEAQKELVKQSIAETQSLFDSRMDYYFN